MVNATAPPKGLMDRITGGAPVGLPLTGYFRNMAWVAGALLLSSSGEGTKNVRESELRTTVLSNDPKKKARSRTMGPPRVAPGWWRLKTALGNPRELFSKLFPASNEFRQ